MRTVVDRTIETLRAAWESMSRNASSDNGAAYRDGFRAGLRQATLDVEHMLRGTSQFEGLGLPDPKDTSHQTWCIPMMWRQDLHYSASPSAEVPKLSHPTLTLQRFEVDRGQWSWLVRPQIWTP